MIITIDGPAGTGKTTVARRVAECLNFPYFDTGAMYRCVSWYALQCGADIEDEKQIRNLLDHFEFRITGSGQDKRYFVGKEDVTGAIRSNTINRIVSIIAAMPSVRSSLTSIQRDFAKQGNAVFEGRDLGTVVFPDAEIKVFLTARPDVRAQRRLDEMLIKHPKEVEGMGREQMIEEMKRRDILDSTRSVAPLKCPSGALVIDTSDFSIDDVVKKILEFKIALGK